MIPAFQLRFQIDVQFGHTFLPISKHKKASMGGYRRQQPARRIKTEAKARVSTKERPAKRALAAKVTIKSKAVGRKVSKSEENSQRGAIRPKAEECIYATASLAKLHPHVVKKNDERRKTLLESCGLRDSITDSIVGTMLSQNTTDKNSKAAFANLKKSFPSWPMVTECEDLGRIEKSIKVAGLAKTRAERIRLLLRTVKEERGEPSFDYLRSMSDDDIKQELSRFKGLGPKTISCVLLFALGRPEFPVDTHVLRISKKMGWVPQSATRESAYDHLNATVPPKLKLDLHCLLVAHGKHCHACASNGKPQFPPSDGSKLDCPLTAKTIHMFGDRTGIKAEGNPDAIESSSVKVKLESDGGDGIPTCTISRCDVGTSRGLVRIKKE